MSKNTNVIVALLAGAAVGAGVGMLFAPAKGSKTRKRISNKYTSGKDQLKDKYDRVLGKVKGRFSNMTDDLAVGIDQMIDEGKHSSEHVIKALEEKLAKLKAEVKKA